MLDGMQNMGNKLVDRFFRRVDEVVWDLMSGRVGIKTADGIATLEGTGEDAQVSVNMFEDFGVPLPAFAQQTPIESVKEGDLIYNARKLLGWVIACPSKTAKGTKAFKLLKPDGTRGEWRPPKLTSLGLDLGGAMVLRSLVNTLPDGGLGQMQSALLPMMMLGGDNFGDMEKMLPLLLMSQCGIGGMTPTDGTAAAANPMGNMMQMMFMMQMMGGRGGDGKPGKTWFDRH